MIEDDLHEVALQTGDVLFEAGEDVEFVHFPADGMIAALVLNLSDGATAEAAMIGREGAVGGVISDGAKPAFTRGVVQLGGSALRLSTERLDKAKQKSATLRDHMARYADCLLAQVLQSVGCNAAHDVDARLSRWLLSIRDRTGRNELRITQEFISQMLGVRRSYVTRIIGLLEHDRIISKRRGVIEILDGAKLELRSCECYGDLRRHFDELLPKVYPAYNAR
jgi:CRP-like cAMP-binding protein